MQTISGFQGVYRWLSNFWPCTIATKDGCHIFGSVEEAYQWAKFTNNKDVQNKIKNSETPANAKRIAKIHAADIRLDWDQVKVPIMRALLAQKFAAGSELAAKLLSTGDALIVEENYWGDTFWGVCRGKGENNLGKLLMEQRAKLM